MADGYSRWVQRMYQYLFPAGYVISPGTRPTDGTVAVYTQGASESDDTIVWSTIESVVGADIQLSELQDVTIDTIASGEILKWNGSIWVNNTLAEADIASASTLSSHTGDSTVHYVQTAITSLGTVTVGDIDAIANYTTNTDVSWNASTVSQVEAEAGVATTDRKWTAERVAQAIAALAGGSYTDADAVDAIEAVSAGVAVLADTVPFIDATDGVLKQESLSDINAILDHDALLNFASGEHFTQASITTVGTIASGTWQGTAVASAYLDADTAHLSGTQTFTGTKTFTGGMTISTGNITVSNVNITGANLIGIGDSSTADSQSEGFRIPIGSGGYMSWNGVDSTDNVDFLANDATDIQVRFRNAGAGDVNVSIDGALSADGNIDLTGAGGSARIYMGGASLGVFGIAYNAANPAYGVFYTEGSPDYVSLSPNGNITAPALKVDGSGVLTTSVGGTSTQWDTAYGWGDHGSAGYSTGSHYVITDTFAAGEVTQLQNINSVTITNTQWGYLGAMGGQPLESSWTGSTSVVTLGTITTGTWTGSTISTSYLGDGHSTTRTGHNKNTGSTASTVAIGNHTHFSDERLKTNITRLTIVNPVSLLKQIPTVSFNWDGSKTDYDTSPMWGFNATEIYNLEPRLTMIQEGSYFKNPDYDSKNPMSEKEMELRDLKAVDANAMIALLVETVKVLTNRIETLESQTKLRI